MNNNRVGYRFSPTEAELINFYLKNKILGNEWLVDDSISEINIYSYEPKFLPSLSKIKSNDLEWYFFSPYESTKRGTRRVAGSGYWKLTGVAIRIMERGRDGGEIGIKRVLVYSEAPDRVSKSDWVMYEYHITCLPPDQRTYVIRKIMYKGEGRDFPSCGNEVGNFSSDHSVVGNFPSGGNDSSDLCRSVVAESSSASAATRTKMDKRQKKLPSKQIPVGYSNTVRAANFAKMYKLLQNLPSVERQGKLNSDDAP